MKRRPEERPNERQNERVEESGHGRALRGVSNYADNAGQELMFLLITQLITDVQQSWRKQLLAASFAINGPTKAYWCEQ